MHSFLSVLDCGCDESSCLKFLSLLLMMDYNLQLRGIMSNTKKKVFVKSIKTILKTATLKTVGHVTLQKDCEWRKKGKQMYSMCSEDSWNLSSWGA